ASWRACSSSDSQCLSRVLSAGATIVTSAASSSTTWASIASRSTGLSTVSLATTRMRLPSVVVVVVVIGSPFGRFFQETSGVSEHPQPRLWRRSDRAGDGDGLPPRDRERGAVRAQRAGHGARAGRLRCIVEAGPEARRAEALPRAADERDRGRRPG